MASDLPNTIFFWLLFGPVLALVVLGLAAAVLMLVGSLIGAASDGLLKIVSTWREAL